MSLLERTPLLVPRDYLQCAAGTSRGWRCIRSDGHFLTVAEFKRLQSIPDHVAIQANNIHSAYLQVLLALWWEAWHLC